MPKIVDHDERRQMIATAALQVIARSGVSGANLRSVAREANCSTGIIAHYFGDKESLLIETLREAMRQQGTEVANAVAKLDGFDRLQAILEAGMTLDSGREATCRIFYHFAGEGMGKPALQEELAGYYIWWRREVSDVIEELQAEGHFDGQDVTTLSQTLVALAEGLAIQGIFNDGQFSTDHQRAILTTYLASFGQTPALETSKS